MRNIILASQSPRRKELLTQIGIEFKVIVSGADENIEEKDSQEFVKQLAIRKAMAVAKEHPEELENSVIIGADTVVTRDGEILGKPVDEADAVAMLQSLSGRGHQVFTGVALLFYEKGILVKTENFAECTEVYAYDMSLEEIKKYVASGEPMDKAGSYGIQGLGGAFIERIHGDYNNVVGLPVSRIYQILKEG